VLKKAIDGGDMHARCASVTAPWRISGDVQQLLPVLLQNPVLARFSDAVGDLGMK